MCQMWEAKGPVLGYYMGDADPPINLLRTKIGGGIEMIKKNDDQVRIECGKGDICVAGGVSKSLFEKVGFVIFSNQEPKPIGSSGVMKKGKINMNDYPVIITFENKECIDIVIEQLKIAKANMD